MGSFIRDSAKLPSGLVTAIFRRWPIVDCLLMEMSVAIVQHTELPEIAIWVCRIYSEALEVAQLVKCLHCKHKGLGSIPKNLL